MGRAPGLIRFAARFSHSLHDGEDAYQRAMEIALVRAPTCAEPQFGAWLRTVVKHEALAIADQRGRESTAHGADIADSASLTSPMGRRPEVVAEWRDRHRAIRDALYDLSESQRTCLMLVSAGFSYDHVCEVTGLTRRTVERAVLSGRAGLHRFEADVVTGAACQRLRPAVERVGAGAAAAGEERRVARHVERCAACRSMLRGRQETALHLASFVPATLIGAPLASLPGADPSLAAAYVDRLANGAVARVGQVTQAALDLSVAGLGRVGAKASVLAIAALIGLPLVADAVTPADRPGTGATAEATLPPATIRARVPAEPAAADPSAAPPRTRPKTSPQETRPARPRPARRAPSAPRTAPGRSTATVPAMPARAAVTPRRAPLVSPPKPTHDPAPAPRPVPRANALEFGP